MGTCKDANGRVVDGLTYEGELNKVRTHACFFGHLWDVPECEELFSSACKRREFAPCSSRPADNVGRVIDVHGLNYIGKGTRSLVF